MNAHISTVEDLKHWRDEQDSAAKNVRYELHRELLKRGINSDDLLRKLKGRAWRRRYERGE